MNRLVACFRKLPGVGTKTALRYAYKVIDGSEEDAQNFAASILDAKKTIKFCSVCGNYTEKDVCDICSARNQKIICVVAQPKDIEPFEKMGTYDGVYHVLHGVLDFQNGIDADKIRIRELLARLNGGVQEVIIATNPDVCGELTSTYLANLIKPLGIKVTRLAYGISVGSEIEYADEVTLQRALSDRKTL
jgi:recombination protein RecR